ncbi:MAG: hypothetical protein ABI597_02525 [Gammaproteobacteria bacterium]
MNSHSTTKTLRQLRQNTHGAIIRVRELDGIPNNKSQAVDDSLTEIKEWIARTKAGNDPLEIEQADNESYFSINNQLAWLLMSVVDTAVMMCLWSQHEISDDANYGTQFFQGLVYFAMFVLTIEGILQPYIAAQYAYDKVNVAEKELQIRRGLIHEPSEISPDIARVENFRLALRQKYSALSFHQLKNKDRYLTQSWRREAWMSCTAINTFAMLRMLDAVNKDELLTNENKWLIRLGIFAELMVGTILLYHQKRDAVRDNQFTLIASEILHEEKTVKSLQCKM